jgi:hypothetical protein
MEAGKRQLEIEKQKETTYKELSAELPDLDRDAIEAMIQDLSDGDWKKLIKTLHFARKGQTAPVELERRAAAAAKQKSSAVVPKPGKPPSNETTYRSLDEAANALTRRIREE